MKFSLTLGDPDRCTDALQHALGAACASHQQDTDEDVEQRQRRRQALHVRVAR